MIGVAEEVAERFFVPDTIELTAQLNMDYARPERI